jgi:hypothetical protein
MKKLVGVGMALSLVIAVAPAMAAGNDSEGFFALNNISHDSSTTLRPMSDERLASVEGGASCIGCSNIAIVVQPNIAVQTLVAVLSENISQAAIAVQGSAANIGQGISP